MNKTKHIYLLDDDHVFRYLTREIIESTTLPFHLTEFDSCQELISSLNNCCTQEILLPDIIFVDLNLPVMDGWDFLDQYISLEKKLIKPIKVYIVSSTMSPYDIEKSKSYPWLSDFFIKPVNEDNILSIMDCMS